MLDLGRDDAVANWFCGRGAATDGEVVGLRATGREDDLGGCSADE
jgi:hypothetical protein